MSKLDSPESATPVDPYRANRELERWLFHGGDQREMSEASNGQRLPSNWNDRASVAFIINYVMTRDENGKIANIEVTYDRPGEATGDIQSSDSVEG